MDMNNNKPYRTNYEKRRQARPFPNKDFTDYSITRSFQRIHFYLDVLETHFSRLGVALTDTKAQGSATMRKPLPEPEREPDAEEA